MLAVTAKNENALADGSCNPQFSTISRSATTPSSKGNQFSHGHAKRAYVPPQPKMCTAHNRAWPGHLLEENENMSLLFPRFGTRVPHTLDEGQVIKGPRHHQTCYGSKLLALSSLSSSVARYLREQSPVYRRYFSLVVGLPLGSLLRVLRLPDN